MFCITGKLVFKSYKPLTLEKGMLFLARKNNSYTVYEMTYVPMDPEEYVQLNGYPVEPYIMSDGNPNVPSEEYILVHPDNIGWWDEGEHTDELRDITVKDYNYILEECNGFVDVEIIGDDEEEEYEEYEDVDIALYDGKVVLSAPDDVDDEEEDETQYLLEGDDEYIPAKSNDEWENNFINQNRYYDQDEE